MKRGGVIAVEGIIAATLLAACAFVYVSRDRRGPEINFPSSKLTYTDSTDTAQLLDGVTATDNKDGDVTMTLRVTSVIPNKDNTEATVEYTAKDRSNNVTKASRTYDYSGNKVLSELNDPTTSETLDAAETDSVTEAVDSIPTTENDSMTGSASSDAVSGNAVGDDAAAVSDETAIAELPTGSPEIRLKTHNVTLAVGDTFSYMDYIDSMTDDKDSNTLLAGQIELNGSVDTSKSGTYEVTYTLRDSDGNISNQPTLTVTVQ